jgi:hypothetical protein
MTVLVGIGHMLNHCSVEHDIKGLSGLEHMLCEAVPVIDGKVFLRRMPARNLDKSRRSIYADNICTPLRQRFAEQPRTAAHIQDPQSRERRVMFAIPTKVPRDPMEDDVAADWVEPVDGPKFTVGVPPLFSHRREPGDFAGVDRFGMRPRLAETIS